MPTRKTSNPVGRDLYSSGSTIQAPTFVLKVGTRPVVKKGSVTMSFPQDQSARQTVSNLVLLYNLICEVTSFTCADSYACSYMSRYMRLSKHWS